MSTLTLRSYLDTKYTNSADWNVTGIGSGWAGKYAIPDHEYNSFLDLLHDHVFDRGRACSLLERHTSISPVLVDLDFRYASGGPLRRRFSDEQVRNFVAAYADAVSHFFEPTAEPLQFFVMTKPAPEADIARDAHKDGIHIVCPSLSTTPEIQFAIRGWLLQNGDIERVFGPTGMTNSPQDCLDLSVIQRNNWFYYGACKPDKAWYKVEHVYAAMIPDDATIAITADHLEEEPADSWTSRDMVRLLSIRRTPDAHANIQLRAGASEVEWTQLVQRWGKGTNWAKPMSPGLFGRGSTTTHSQSSNVINHDPAPFSLNSTIDDMVQISDISVRSTYTAEDTAMAYKLVRECLDPESRCGDYQDWINLGLCLKNIADNDESLRCWADISRRTGNSHKKSRFTDAQFREKWKILPAEMSAMQKGRKPLLMGTLHLWAREDSPAAYRLILNDANKELAFLNDSGTHVSVADLVVRMYRHEFRCTPMRKGAGISAMDWYQFAGHTWQNLKTAMTLRARLSNDVRNVYIAADCEVGRREMATTDQSERERLQAKRKNLIKVEANLQNSGFKDSVMKEAAEKFYDEEFLQYMNQDPCILGFNNGVLELRHPGENNLARVVFRPGRPDDCISFQMGRGLVGMDAIPYIPYDPSAPLQEHNEINEFFTTIYPNPVLREYCLTLYAACLEGANHEQKFYIMSGTGSNGKSKIIDLMSKTFGEYQESLPVTALTRKRADAGSANPEMIVLKCKRFVSMVEPEEGEKINTSLMKQLSGQDTLKARGLFQDQDQFVVTARIFMSCNDLPAVSSMDNGTWRRLRVIPHVAKFVDPGVPTDPLNHIHTKDLLMDGKITRWRPYFAGMLVWYYEHKYLRGGLKEPLEVTSASNKYKEENDAFAAFAQECLIREVGVEVGGNDVFLRYKEWNKFNNNGKYKVLGKKDVIQKLTDIFGKPIDIAGRMFAGFRLTEEGEDVSGGTM